MYKDLKIKMGMVVSPMLKDQNHQKEGEAITKSIRVAKKATQTVLIPKFLHTKYGQGSRFKRDSGQEMGVFEIEGKIRVGYILR
jgi:DNA repair photolyase